MLRGAPSHCRVKPVRLPSVRLPDSETLAVCTDPPAKPAPPFRLTAGKVAPPVIWKEPSACEPPRRSSPPVVMRTLIDDTMVLAEIGTGPRPQMLLTSPTQIPSHAVVQQNGSR